MPKPVKLDGAVSVLSLEREISTAEGYARRVLLDRDAPKLAIVFLVLGVIGLAVTLSGVAEDVARGGAAGVLLAELYGGRDPSGAVNAGALLFAWLPVALLLAGLALLVREWMTRQRRDRAAFERYLRTGRLALQHSLGSRLYTDRGDGGEPPRDLVALSTPFLDDERFAAELLAMRAAVAVLREQGASSAASEDVLQTRLGNPRFREAGQLASEFWPEAPAAIVLATRRDGDVVVVLEPDSALPGQPRAILAIRQLPGD